MEREIACPECDSPIHWMIKCCDEAHQVVREAFCLNCGWAAEENDNFCIITFSNNQETLKLKDTEHE